MLRVMILHPARTARGGIVNATLAYALGLVRRGHAVEVWTASPSLAARCENHGIAVFLHPAIASAIKLNLSCAIWRRGRDLRAAGVDAVIHQGARSWVWSRLQMRRTGHAVVFHNRKMGGRRRFDHWLVLSHAHAADLAADPRCDGKTVHVIRNGYLPGEGADAELPRNGGRRSYRVGTLCGLVRHKGVDVLLRAVAEASAAGVPVELLVGGAGPEETDLKNLADELGVTDAVRWLGWVDDQAAFFREIDLFCLPSRREPFGLALIEAMAAAVPAIASATDGPADILAHDRTGWLFPIDDSQALGDLICQTFLHPANRIRVGERGKAEAERNFRAEAAAATLECALSNIVSEEQTVCPPGRRPLVLSGIEPFAKGGYRHCYVHPDNADLCVKVAARIEDPKCHTAQRREIADCLWLKKHRSGALSDRIPAFEEIVETDRGVGIVMRLCRDSDGRISRNLAQIVGERGLTPPLARAVDDLERWLRKHRLLTSDTAPKNVAAVHSDGGRWTLVIVEGWRHRRWRWLARLHPVLADWLIRRQMRKFRRRLARLTGQS